MWIFGYGSLIWKSDFPYEEQKIVYIHNYVRRLWQLSTDHRGTPTHPGRVLTLIPYDEWKTKFESMDPHEHHPDDVIYGVAYKIADKDIEHVRAHLDFREKDGYQTFQVPIFIDSTSNDRQKLTPFVSNAYVYVATTENENFSPIFSLHSLASHILQSHGDSGSNIEYVLELCKSLRKMNVLDRHLMDLEDLIQTLKE